MNVIQPNSQRISHQESKRKESQKKRNAGKFLVRLHTNTVTDVRDVNREEEREREEKPRIFYYEICSFLCRCFVEISTFVFCSVPRHLNKMAIQMMVMASKHENKMEQTALGKK